MKQILLIEDDPQIRELVQDYFDEKADGEMTLLCAKTGKEGINMLAGNAYDLVLLDVMLPGINGFEICRIIRKNSIVPILFLTAMGREEDVLYGFSLGCDDYIVKPFSLAQLLAKVRALLNRAGGTVINQTICCGTIRMNIAAMKVYADGREVELPPKEYEILKLLMENPNRVFSRDELVTRLWGYDADVVDRVVDNHVKNLRRLLGQAGGAIRTLYKKGYRLEQKENGNGNSEEQKLEQRSDSI